MLVQQTKIAQSINILFFKCLNVDAFETVKNNSSSNNMAKVFSGEASALVERASAVIVWTHLDYSNNNL